jgi:hypothetical protein
MPNHAITTQYLRVIGRLYADRRLVLRAGYLTETPPWTDREGAGPLRAGTFNANGAALGEYPVRVSEVCLDGGRGPRPQAVRAFLPFHPDTSRVVFTFEGHPIHEVVRSHAAPRVELAWRPEGHPVSGRQTVRWSATHPEGLPLQFLLRFSHDAGRSWSRIGHRTEGLEDVVDFDALPGGECRLAVVATDGINTVVAPSETFTLPRKPCVAMILHPVDGERYAGGQAILLQGQGYWRELAQPEREHLEWQASDQDRPLGHGARLEVTLPPGRHTIGLLAGEVDYRGRAEVSIQVG